MSNILILDDETAILDLCQCALTTEGIKSDAATSIEQAKGLLKTKGPYSLLICDLKLPDGHGMDFINIFWRSYPDANVIVITQHPKLLAEKETGNGALSQIEYLMKPFEMSDLLKRVNILLGKPS